jgi:hypothetical protein
MRRIVSSWLAALCFMATVGSATAADQPHEGHSPLATASILVDRNDISVMQGALKRFAELERLEYLEDQFMRKAHVVHQFYLKERDMPVFYIDNFRDSDRFRVTAYAGDNSEAWEPRWARLLSLLKSELGPHAVTQ